MLSYHQNTAATNQTLGPLHHIPLLIIQKMICWEKKIQKTMPNVWITCTSILPLAPPESLILSYPPMKTIFFKWWYSNITISAFDFSLGLAQHMLENSILSASSPTSNTYVTYYKMLHKWFNQTHKSSLHAFLFSTLQTFPLLLHFLPCNQFLLALFLQQELGLGQVRPTGGLTERSWSPWLVRAQALLKQYRILPRFKLHKHVRHPAWVVRCPIPVLFQSHGHRFVGWGDHQCHVRPSMRRPWPGSWESSVRILPGEASVDTLEAYLCLFGIGHRQLLGVKYSKSGCCPGGFPPIVWPMGNSDTDNL